MADHDPSESVDAESDAETRPPTEYYTNAFVLNLSAWDLVLDHGLRGPKPTDLQLLFRQRMSLEHAWVMCKLVDRALTQYIKDNGPITILKGLVDELKLTSEYDAQLQLTKDSDEHTEPPHRE